MRYAALEANLGDDYKVKILPKPKNLLDVLMEGFSATARTPASSAAASASLQAALPWLATIEPEKADVIMRMVEQLRVFQQEKVLTVMPGEIVIR